MRPDVKPVKRPRTPIAASFKPKAGQREIRVADKEKAVEAGNWAVKAYPAVFEKLAQ